VHEGGLGRFVGDVGLHQFIFKVFEERSLVVAQFRLDPIFRI